MKRTLIITLLSILSFSTFGQGHPEEIIKKFFDTYGKNSNEAIDELYATNPWATRLKDGIENMKKEVSGYTVDYVGEYYGYEPITKKQLSESFVLCSFLVRYDRQPMRFTFEFYKPNDTWTLFSFKIDTDLDDEIEQAARLYYLNLDGK